MIKVITKLQIKENTNLFNLLRYKEIEFKNLTIIMGANGTGKSSILQGIDRNLKSDNSGYYGSCAQSINLEFNGKENIYKTLLARSDNGKYRGYFGDDISLDIKMMYQSEGQSTMTLFFNLLNQLEKALNNKENMEKDIVFLIDELDSGLSFDNILKIILTIKNLQEKYPNIQIIFTAHNYEFARTFVDNIFCIDFGQYVDLSSYKTYRNYYETHLLYQLKMEEIRKEIEKK
jgi:predicted ATPase